MLITDTEQMIGASGSLARFYPDVNVAVDDLSIKLGCIKESIIIMATFEIIIDHAKKLAQVL